jgi:hypothetical protein
MFCALLRPALALDAPRIWRVCITDSVAPPYLTNDAAHPGIIERILVRSGAEVGLDTLLIRYPALRCRAMMEAQSLDAWIAAPTPGNLATAQFPMKDGAIDPGRRIARINLVWVKRGESPYDWLGGRLKGGTPSELLVGTRAGVQAAIGPVQELGFKVDATASSAHQLLLKLQRGRVDMAAAFQDEVEVGLQDPALQGLVVLPTALSSTMIYVAVRKNLPPEMMPQVESWWTAIGRLREMPEYRAK